MSLILIELVQNVVIIIQNFEIDEEDFNVSAET